ncbi:MAG: bile acid:sodium symporter [Hyphomonadaceae bacterium]|nr:bile acid:sodium symporter [Hyphomonadaceae bacterium]
MIGMGLSLKLSDFLRVFREKWPVTLGVLSMLIVLPGLGFLMASMFELPPEIAVGIVLVATCPGGMFSNLMTDYARGNLALSITLTAVISTIYVFTIPFWSDLAIARFLATEAEIGLPFIQTLAPLVLFVLLPIAIGVLINTRAPSWAQRWRGMVKNTAAIIVFAIMIFVATSQDSETVENLPAIFIAVIALNLASVAFAAVVGWLGRLSARDMVALVTEHAVRQEGTGIYIAVTLLGSTTMALPLLLNSMVGLLLSLIIILLSRLHQARKGEAQPSESAR